MVKKKSEIKPDEVGRLREKVAELEEHTKVLLVAENRACEAKLNLSRQLEVLRKANDLSTLLGAASNPAAVVEQSIDFVVREFGYECGVVFLFDLGRKCMTTAAAAGWPEFMPRTFSFSEVQEADSVLWTAADANQPVLVSDGVDSSDPASVLGLKTFLVAPLSVENSVATGLLVVGNSEAQGVYYRRVQDEDVSLLRTIAGQIAHMLRKEESHEYLQREKAEIERAQLELRSVNERLEERVREKTQALRDSYEKLEQSRLQLELYSRELERQVAERTKRLLESEQKYRSVVANSRAGMAVYRDEMILEVNPALTGIVGRPLQGFRLSDFVDRVIDPSRRAALREYLSKPGCRAGTPDDNFEVQARREEEDRVWNISSFPLDPENNLFGFLVVDTTESRRVEEQLFDSLKLASLGNLAGGIAHEFNNILVGILGNASLLRTRVTGDREISRPVEMIETSALRAADLVQQLLGFARMGKYRSESLDLNSLVRKTLDLARRSFDRRIEIAVHLNPDLPPVEGDGTQLQQVIMNLCLNAREAMSGGGTLTVETRLADRDNLPQDQVTQRSAEKWVQVSIKDTGVGMDEDTRRMIFEPFFSTKGSGGTGLGLPMVYGIVANHGGIITVTSEIGEGTRAQIYLPAADSEDQTSASLKDLSEKRTGNVLVVDDEEILRCMCQDALSELGFDVHVEADGEAACTYCASEAPIDLVILDLEMPRKGGEETYRDVKKLRPDLKVIICTGTMGEFKEGTAEAILRKPFTFQKLADVVDEVLTAKRET